MVYIAQCSHSGNHLSVTVLIIAVLLLLLLSVFKVLLNPKIKSSKAQKRVLNFKQVRSLIEASRITKNLKIHLLEWTGLVTHLKLVTGTPGIPISFSRNINSVKILNLVDYRWFNFHWTSPKELSIISMSPASFEQGWKRNIPGAVNWRIQIWSPLGVACLTACLYCLF